MGKDTLKLTIIDENEDPVAGADCTIGETTVTSGIDGVAQFSLAYDDYEVTVEKEGYVTATEELAFRSNHKNFSIELEAESPVTVEGITMTYDSSVSRSIAMLTENPMDQTALDGILLDTGVTATIDWGDESETTTYTGPSSFTHTYESDDEFTITVTPSVADGIIGLDDFCFVKLDDGDEPAPTDFGLTSIELPSSATSIGEYCFGGCTSLASVAIPSTVTNASGDPLSWFGIDDQATYTALLTVDLYWTSSAILGFSDTFLYDFMFPDTTFNIPNGTSSDYVTAGYPSTQLNERS